MEKKSIDINTGFMKANNYKVVKLDDEYCEVEGLLDETSLNPYGIAHGGYIFGLADTAAGTLAATRGASYTLDSTIDYLRPSTGKKIVAKCHAIKWGKKVSIFDVELFNEENKMTAKAKINYFYID